MKSRAEQEEIRGDVGGCFMLFIDAENSSKLRALNELSKKKKKEKKIQVSFQLLAKSASRAANKTRQKAQTDSL